MKMKTRLRRYLSLFPAVLLILMMSAVFVARAFAQEATIEFVGEVEALDNASLTVNGVVFDISNAKLDDDLAVGLIVKVRASDENGAFVAYKVEVEEEDEADLTAIVEAFDGSSITLAGRTFDLAGARIEQGVAVGEVVEIHFDPADDNSWSVREVHLEDDSDARKGRFEFEGPLDEVGVGYIIVAGQRIEATNARMEGFLVLRTEVEVDFTAQDGVWTAVKIEGIEEDGGRRLMMVGPDCAVKTPTDWTTHHTMQRGDSLSVLALQTGVSLEQIVRANCITHPGHVAAGTALMLPHTPDSNITLHDDHGKAGSGDQHDGGHRSGGDHH